MTATSDSPEVELLRRAWEAMTGGDFAVLEDALAEDAKWRSVSEGSTNCEGRGTIIEMMSRNLAGRLRGRIEEMSQIGPRLIVGFRPERPWDAAGQPSDAAEWRPAAAGQPSDAAERPLDNGIAYMVVTIRDGKIVELKGCADRAAAVSYAQTD